VASGSNSEVSKKGPAPRYAWGGGSSGGNAEAGGLRGLRSSVFLSLVPSVPLLSISR